MHAEQIFIAGPAGRLEAVFKRHPAPRGAAVVCHPHPRYGGTMHNKVVYRAARALYDCGFTVLRFNFRGVEASEGAFDEGIGERDDLRAALDHLAGEPGVRISAGFSFGAWVALDVGESDPRVQALIAIGLATEWFDFDFVARGTKPMLVVQGERDDLARLDRVHEIVAGAGSRASLTVIPGADHFLTEHLDPMMDAVRGFARTL